MHTCLPFLQQAGPSVGGGSCSREIPRDGGTGSECVNDPEDEMLWKQLRAGVRFSVPYLVSLAMGQALGNPEVSSIRNTRILISKNPSEWKSQVP